MGNQITTTLRIVNNTNTDIVNTIVTRVDPFDFYPPYTPSETINGLFIGAKSSIEKREDLYSIASQCAFNIVLQFRNGLEDSFRIFQRFAIDGPHGFESFIKSHNIHYNRNVEYKRLTITIESTYEEQQNELAEKLYMDAIILLGQQDYPTALKKFNSARNVANENSTITKISNYIDFTESLYEINFIDKLRNMEINATQTNVDEIETLLKGARTFFENASKPNSVARVNNISAILSKYKEACALLDLNMYDDALKTLNEALKMEDAKITMGNMITKKRKEVYNRYGISILVKTHIENLGATRERAAEIETLLKKARDLFEQSGQEGFLKLIDRKLRIINLCKQAQAAVDQGNYEEALTKLHEALPNTDQRSTAETLLVYIKSVNLHYGQHLLTKAISAENYDAQVKIEEIQVLLSKAKDLFEEADQKDFIAIVNLKLKILSMYQEAGKLETKAAAAFKVSKDDALKKYTNVLLKYDDIQNTVNHGLKLNFKAFSVWQKILDQDTASLKEVIQSIKVKLLQDATKGITFEEPEDVHIEEKQTVNVNNVQLQDQ